MNNLFTVFEVERIGKALAHEGNERQAAIINAMASELVVSCVQDRHYDMQKCYISDELDKRGREFIKSLAEFVALRETEEQS